MAQTKAGAATGVRKAAILLMAMDQEAAARILRAIPQDKVEQVSREVANLADVLPEQRIEIVSEFYHLVLAHRYTEAGGLPYARALLEKSLPSHEARRIIQSIEHQMYKQPFAFLQKTEKDHLLMFLKEEHPQTIALVLSHVPEALAAEFLISLDPERQMDVVQRVAKMDQTSPEVISEVERGLESRLAGMATARFERAGGVNAVASILNLAGRAAEKSIMEGLADQDPELVEAIRRLMFVFEDIQRVNDKGIQAVLKEIDNTDLALALRTASEELQTKIFSNMSERASQLIKEEMEFMGPVRVSDVEGAQQKIVEVVRRLEDAGELFISGKGGEGELVV